MEVLKRILRLARLSNFMAIGKNPVATIRIPYLMIQPRVDNKEVKILLLERNSIPVERKNGVAE